MNHRIRPQSLLVASLLLVAAAPLSSAAKRTKADEKVSIALAPKVGKLKYAYKMVASVAGQEAEISATIDWNIKKVENDQAEIEATWNEFKLTMGGSEPAINLEPQRVTYVPSTGLPKSIAGGITGTDEARTYLLFHFIAPKDPVAVGDTYTFEAKADEKASLPGFKYEGKYLGVEQEGGAALYKFSAKYSEAANDSFGANTTFFVRQDGTLVRAESTFRHMPLPQFGAEFDGKATIKQLS